jgi:hypothetical protein
MYINQQDAQISVIKLYFPLDALHVSDCISPSSGATFHKLYIAFGIFGYVWLSCGYRKECSPSYMFRHLGAELICVTNGVSQSAHVG